MERKPGLSGLSCIVHWVIYRKQAGPKGVVEEAIPGFFCSIFRAGCLRKLTPVKSLCTVWRICLSRVFLELPQIPEESKMNA